MQDDYEKTRKPPILVNGQLCLPWGTLLSYEFEGRPEALAHRGRSSASTSSPVLSNDKDPGSRTEDSVPWVMEKVPVPEFSGSLLKYWMKTWKFFQ